MEYTIKQLANMAGISTRTLRYYDSIGLLSPSRITDSGYRIYNAEKVSTLQQILFYKELDFELSTIKSIIYNPDFNKVEALEEQLHCLEQKKRRLDKIIANVKSTILSEKGEIIMADTQKFEGLKQSIIDKNEKTYGDEIRKKYGNELINKSNERFKNMSEKEFLKMNELSEKINSLLEDAVKNGKDPMSEAGKAIALLHKEWLSFYWENYSVKAHTSLGEMYTADKRFADYYDKNINGCADFLSKAISAHAINL